jgi:hypothetical protein
VQACRFTVERYYFFGKLSEQANFFFNFLVIVKNDAKIDELVKVKIQEKKLSFAYLYILFFFWFWLKTSDLEKYN